MRFAFAAVWLLALAGTHPTKAVDLSAKTVSASKQFIVFCQDANLRNRLAGFADETRAGVLKQLDQGDDWRAAIVLNVHTASEAGSNPPPSRVQVFVAEEGFKVQIDVNVSSDPTAVALQEQIIRAVLIEFAARRRPVRAGQPYAEPPLWLVEGISEKLRREVVDSGADVFQTLLDANRLPSIGEFLKSSPGERGSTSHALYRACAMSLVNLLSDLPRGREGLAAMVQDSGASTEDPAENLKKHFPALAASSGSLEKWWSLGVARLAAGDRYHGLTAAETDKRVSEILVIELPTGTAGQVQELTLADYRTILKSPKGRDRLTRMANELVSVGALSNPLFRPVIAEYEEIARRLARGKTGGAEARLKAVGEYRRLMLKRVDDVADYLNWMEATQMKTGSQAFDGYLKAASAIEAEKPARNDPVSRYLNEMELSAK